VENRVFDQYEGFQQEVEQQVVLLWQLVAVLRNPLYRAPKGESQQENLTMGDFEAIHPHITQIVVHRRNGLTREGVAVSWLGRHVQPLQQRLNYV